MSLSSFEQALREYPILRRIVPELEPCEFRNLLLAGVNMPMTRTLANKFLIRRDCIICGFTNEKQRVHPCIGCYSEHWEIDLQGDIETRWYQKLTNEPHEIEICEACIPATGGMLTDILWLNSARMALLRKSVQKCYFMCKEHCLENYNASLALPPGQCDCRAFLDEGNPANEKSFRCDECLGKTEMSLHLKAAHFKTALRYRQTTTNFADSYEYSGTELSLDETCCMLDCKEKIWDDVNNPAFLAFCPSCATVFKQKDVLEHEVDGTSARELLEKYLA